MRNIMLVVRLFDMLTGSGFYEMTRYSNGKCPNMSTNKFMAWRRRTARRLWTQKGVCLLIPFMIVGTLLTTLVPALGIVGFGLTGSYIFTVVIAIILFPPIGLLML